MRSRIASTFWVLLAVASSAFGQATNMVQILSDNTGLLEISDVVSSPDGSQVYVASKLGTVSLFARNTGTGRLTFVELYQSRVGAFRDMEDIRTAVMAPDGRHLYLRCFGGIVALRRSEDGRLHPLQVQGQGITSLFFTLSPLAIHSSGRFLFATQASDSGFSIVVFQRDSSTGLLSPAEPLTVQQSDAITNLALSPDGRHLYSLNDTNSITAYSIASGNGGLTFQSRFQAGVAGVPDSFRASEFEVSPDGRHIYVSSNDRDSTFLLLRNASGDLSYGSELTSSGIEADQRTLALSPNGTHVYICREFNKLEVYRRDSVTGALQRTANSVETPDTPACRAMAFSSDGKSLYMPTTFDGSLLIFNRQSGSGALTYEDRLEYGENAPEGLANPVAVAVSGDGNHVYAADAASEQIGVYRRDRRNGKLAFVESLQEGKYRSLLLSPNGAFLYGLGTIPGDRSGIGIFLRDSTTGKLTPAGHQPSDVSGERFAVSRDGKNLYVSLFSESGVAVYQRNATTGQLTLLEVAQDGQGTPDSPSGPTDLAVSPDGRNVYVALSSVDGGGVAVFRRDPVTGRLTLVEAVTDVSSPNCHDRDLSSATSLVVSPDGGNVYAISFSGSPFTFTRNRSNGRLSNHRCNFTPGRYLAVSPDGRFVYAYEEGGTDIFYRTPTSGRLWRVLVGRRGFDAFGGRGNPIAVSPDGKNVYIPAAGAGLVVLGEEGESQIASCTPLVVDGQPKRLCFQDSRFAVEVLWRDFEGREGEGTTVSLTPDSAFFYFFSRQNIELFVKLLDGRENNDHFWFYYGALSNVEYSILVTDTRRGKLRIYNSPAHTFASAGDITAFPDAKDSGQEASAIPELLALPDSQRAKAGNCVEGPTTLCLADGRFRAEMTWKDFAGNPGVGKPGSLVPDTNGYFWFFNPENVEVAIKVLDGRGINGYYWVYYASLTNVEFTLTVTDTVTGQSKTYTNPAGRFASNGDIQALPAN